MNRLARSIALVALMVLCRANHAQAAATGAVEPEPADRPLTTLPYSPGLNVHSMDPSGNACVDFYQYACGGWIAQNPIPGDQASWSVYGKMQDDNQHFLWGILDTLAAGKAPRNAVQQQIGDYFAACMDGATVEKRGVEPIRSDLDSIDALRSKADLPALLSRLHMSIGGRGLFFRFGSDQDYADSTQVIAAASAGA